MIYVNIKRSIMNRDEWRRLIIVTLKEIGLFSNNAVELIMGTFAQESNFKYTRQLGGGPSLGYGQMEPTTFNDIVVNFLRYKPDLMGKIMKVSGVVTLEPEMLVDNKTLMICMVRVHYLRVKDPLPSNKDVWAMGEYWKQHYNTPAGKGTVKEFVENYTKYCR